MINKDIETNYVQLASLKDNNVIKFSSRVAFAIVRNIKILQPIYQDIITTRHAIVKKYGTLVSQDAERGDYYDFGSEEKLEEVMQELKALDEVETSVDIQKIKFSDIEDINLSIEEMNALYFMLDEY